MSVAVLLGCAWGSIALVAIGRGQRSRLVRSLAATERAVARRESDAGSPRRGRHAHLDRLRRHRPMVWSAWSALGRRRREVRRRRARRRRARAIEGCLPVAVALLAVSASAGCTPVLAVAHAARWAPAPIAEVFGSVVDRHRLGRSLEAAILEAAVDDPALAPIASVLAGSLRTGAPVAPVLVRLAGAHRRALRRDAERRARAMSVRLLFPLVFLVLPAFGLLVVAPALLRGFGAVS